MASANTVNCDVRKLELILDSFTISFTSFLSSKYENNKCSINYLNSIDLIKVDEDKFAFGCVGSDKKPYIDLITVSDSNSNGVFDLITKQTFNVNKKVKSTMNLFTHRLFVNNNYFGIVFNDESDGKVKYGYLNLPMCSKKSNIEALKLKFGENEENTFKLSDYLDLFEIPYVDVKYTTSTSIQKYKIISFISNDNDQNIFNYIIYSGYNQLNLGDIIAKDEIINIKPAIDKIIYSGQFYIEVAPFLDGRNTTGRSCLFEFDAICYEGCSTCKKYDSTLTDVSKHFCLTCKSNYYALNDLCLKECSLVPGYHDVFQTKECFFQEMEFINDCTYKIWYINQTSEKNSCLESSFCPQSIPYVYNSTGECIEACRYSELIDEDCYISNILGGGMESLNNINAEISLLGDDIMEKNDLKRVNKSIVIYGNNITIEISDTQKLNNDINKNDFVSELNITDCEYDLKNKINIPDDMEIIVVKIDLRRNDTISTQVEYELFDPVAKSLIDLSSSTCKSIVYKSPIYVNDSYYKKIKEIHKEGYDIFFINNLFYSDICVPFYDKNFNADLTLEKRQIVYYYMNANLCEKKCTYDGFDIEPLKAICSCPIKTVVDLDIAKEDVFDYVEDTEKIYHKETISNLKAAKCFKYIFSKKGFTYNWGSYFMMLMIIGFIVFTVLWFVEGEDLILVYIREILDLILIRNEMKYKGKVKQKFEEMKTLNKSEIKTNKNNENDKKSNGAEQPIQSKNNEISESKENSESKEKQEDKEKSENVEDKNKEIDNNDSNEINNKDIITSKNQLIEKENEFFRKKGPKKNALLIRSINLNKENKLKEDKIIPPQPKNPKTGLTDIEIDSLPYNKAKEIDQRTYFEYYWSQLKYRQLILFTFFSFNDYNFFYIKVLCFFLLLSLNLSYNIIFFFDKVINQIYDDKGKYSIKLQILNVIICSLIFSFSIILCRLAIKAHRKYIKLKQYEIYEEAQKESYSIHKRLVIRYIIFIIFDGILLVGMWYFVTGFCAIFHYTQNHMFLNAFFSFLLSMIYPFAYLLLPALFRYLGFQS